jgi:hypothetical protein
MSKAPWSNPTLHTLYACKESDDDTYIHPMFDSEAYLVITRPFYCRSKLVLLNYSEQRKTVNVNLARRL